MIWLSIKQVSELEQVSERTVRRNIEKYKYRHINGVGGKNGIKYEVVLESLSPEAQARYHGEQTTKDPSGLVNLTDAERDIAFAKQTIILSYQEFKGTYPKADKLQAFLRQYNEQHPEKPLTKRQLNHWETQYKRDGVTGLADKRGGWNKSQSSIPEDVKKVFLAYWLQEKGTKRGGPSVATCYNLIQMVFPDRQLPSVSAFKRMTESIPLPTKILAREGKKAFDDKCMPYIPFDYRSICTNQQWVADNHIFDVQVLFPDGRVGRAWIIGWMDRRSRYIVGYHMLPTDPNADAILEAFARSVKGYGIPESVLLDNGKDYVVHDLFNRNFALSLANEMTISVTNAIKYNAKAKPIERFFRTLEYSYCIHLPSYIGADPKKRPEKLKKVNEKLKDIAIPYDDFVAFIDGVIRKYNNTVHNGDAMDGMTPCQAFEANISVPIRVANPLLLYMLFQRTTKPLTVGRNGIKIPALNLYYDSDELFPYQGKKVYARYDVADVRQVCCISEEGNVICMATSTALGNLDKELTAQNMRLLNSKKKQRRKMANDLIPDVAVPSVQQLAIEWGMSFSKPDLKLLPTMQTVNSTQQKKAQDMKDAEQRKEKKGKTVRGIDQRDEDEAFYKFMIGG